MKQILRLLLFLPFMSQAQKFDIQGHRGCRGLLPENSIEAMKKAIDLGVTTLEMDVVISKDKQVLLSHEPFLSHEICLDKENQTISEATEQSFNLYQMNYDEIKKCDCGSKIHPRFLEQEKIKINKPLLIEVIDFVEKYIQTKYPNKKIFYNIETKSDPKGDEIYHPLPNEFVDLLVNVLENKNIIDRTYIQSFDVRTLQYLHQKYTSFKTVLLVENKLSINDNLKRLGFKPTVYSPDFILLDKQKVDYLHAKNIKVIPWTVNKKEDMQTIMSYGVDGLITDYPNRYFELKKHNFF
ncbi:glycerophosphodiester phosphodiesterase [Flavobacterium columnare NBRC 100251 = ATCC 23463]|uniref:Glycerophosphodiester phosphodiesterase n=1 Tax=Flavobacterium columnare (strain ATCC 49512 / CIP 103533 / TG 44/87) TaxID=1041826 RepID=G8X869_FLACA|nr:glycerophosphodiester phosphodiesterase [Flavobacterium columnare]AEW85006.1 glycerophosphodiester phosphodiesterase [Flavobacterium columnare ATCC 49512]ANO49220.1 glycerophosphodiester phosphodiesterase [Flavobacterium columnare]APT22789.1 glycerophosphodiester phosphodiesterase [Flavobacterium columnare]MBF6653057.1 glycerophosphodiester phosphodiesterase [Flavobacterium columnare]MBF6655958.1 glycerophosphodiester phosphodiesterase [Flavobacterium columnare]